MRGWKYRQQAGAPTHRGELTIAAGKQMYAFETRMKKVSDGSGFVGGRSVLCPFLHTMRVCPSKHFCQDRKGGTESYLFVSRRDLCCCGAACVICRQDALGCSVVCVAWRRNEQLCASLHVTVSQELPAKGSYVLTLCFWQRVQHVASRQHMGASFTPEMHHKCACSEKGGKQRAFVRF